MVVVSDTSPITNLLKIGQMHLLREVFVRVVIPAAVHRELLEWKKLGGDVSEFEFADWIEMRTPSSLLLVEELRQNLDAGESEAIALAHELKADYLIIDERRGWKTAKTLGVQSIGLIGVLLEAKKKESLSA